MSKRQYAASLMNKSPRRGYAEKNKGYPLHRTKAPIIYKAAGNVRAVQILLGQTKIENTLRYLGVNVEDAHLTKRPSLVSSRFKVETTI